METAFLTGFNRQCKKLKKVVKKHWPILKSDNTLKTLLPSQPTFIYRRAPTLGNNLVHNALDVPKQIRVFPNLKGFFKCNKCLPCRVSQWTSKKKESFRSISTGKEYKNKKLITCNSTHVTYVLEYPCRLEYVGRTTKPL